MPSTTPTETAATNSRSGSPATSPRSRHHAIASASGDAGAGDRRAARAAVGLQHVAVDLDRALAERREIGDRAQAAADQALDLLRAARLLAVGGLAPAARVRRARQHAVLGGEPAAPLALEERRHAFLDAGGAQHLRVAGLDQHRAFGVLRVAAGDAERAQLVGAPARSANGHRRLSMGQRLDYRAAAGCRSRGAGATRRPSRRVPGRA